MSRQIKSTYCTSGCAARKARTSLRTSVAMAVTSSSSLARDIGFVFNLECRSWRKHARWLGSPPSRVASGKDPEHPRRLFRAIRVTEAAARRQLKAVASLERDLFIFAVEPDRELSFEHEAALLVAVVHGALAARR